MAIGQICRDDPMERLIKEGLDAGGIPYVRDPDPLALNLDFYLVDDAVHIEVKRFHTGRVAEQMSRTDNVIVAQGEIAVRLLASLLSRQRVPTAVQSAGLAFPRTG